MKLSQSSQACHPMTAPIPQVREPCLEIWGSGLPIAVLLVSRASAIAYSSDKSKIAYILRRYAEKECTIMSYCCVGKPTICSSLSSYVAEMKKVFDHPTQGRDANCLWECCREKTGHSPLSAVSCPSTPSLPSTPFNSSKQLPTLSLPVPWRRNPCSWVEPAYLLPSTSGEWEWMNTCSAARPAISLPPDPSAKRQGSPRAARVQVSQTILPDTPWSKMQL